MESYWTMSTCAVVSAALVHCKHAGTSEILKSLEDKLTSAAVPATLVQYKTVSTSETKGHSLTTTALSNNTWHLRRMRGSSQCRQCIQPTQKLNICQHLDNNADMTGVTSTSDTDTDITDMIDVTSISSWCLRTFRVYR